MEQPLTGKPGWIEVIVGSMFSGKSEELIRRLRRAKIASQPVTSAAEMFAQVRPETEVVGIDEGQFFDSELPAVCSKLASQGKRVIVAGLDQDYLGKPF